MSFTPIPHSPSGDVDLNTLLETHMQEVADMVVDIELTIPSMDPPSSLSCRARLALLNSPKFYHRFSWGLPFPSLPHLVSYAPLGAT
jgi:hypothetical protein